MNPLADLTMLELWIAGGRFLLMVTGFLLAVKHARWLFKEDTDEHYWFRVVRHLVEFLVGAVVFLLYAVQTLTEPQGASLSQADTVVVVWAFALLMAVLVISRNDAR